MAAPRKDNIKEKILQATTELLKTTALADISLAEIAAAAGISKGTLYYHYKTKNEVFLDITQRFLDEQWEDLIRWTENKEKDTSLNRLVRYVASPWPTGPVEFGRALNPKVFLLKLTPGLGPELIPAIFQQYDCVIVESFGVGGIPQRLMDAFAEELGDYDKTHKILILTTQVTYEGSDVGIYEVGKRVKNRFRFLEAHDMTIEAVVTKVMWLLAQNCENFDQLQQRFYRQINFDTFYH